MTRTEYMREYRKKNYEKIKAYEKERSAKRRAARKGIEQISKAEPQAPSSNRSSLSDSGKPKRCMAADCDSTQTIECSIAGMKAWLCDEHQPKK